MLRLSYSQISLYEKCPILWYAAYVQELPKAPNKHFQFGGVVHKSLENHFNQTPVDLTLNDFSLWPNAEQMVVIANHLVDGTLEVVNKYLPQGELQSEVRIEYPDFVGVLDLIIDRKHVVDFKTTSAQYTEHDIISHEQLTCYAWLFQRKFGFIPQTLSIITQNKNSGSVDWYSTTRTQNDVNQWVEKVRGYRFQMEAGLTYKNTGSCVDQWGKCELYQSCWGHRMKANPSETSKFGFI